ncbi:hypothetical protein BA195_02640 [Tenacibaculum soleae]|uniref:DUF4302 domain-containing protein n=1 Tax=Tenacibaculum soleae TaxID=447689 RepID=A0A1B9Y1C2_9FLAO|nr:DUF4302 domain-containing protein [Tenacibaculum soleae]OCK43618.1 hypothetical protein BA195_02640 [Tenacibaculum soleae]
MKNIINKTFLLLLLIVATVSCDNTEEAIFNETSSERIKNSVIEYRDLLTSSDNGWIIEYYPEGSQSLGGFNYGMKFNEDLTAEVVMELFDFSTRESNMFNVIANGGPVLTFNTYGALSHFFSTPNQANPDGLEGDYEFLLTSKTTDLITLIGAKSRNKMRMIRLTESPEDYLTKVLDIKTYLAPASYAVTLDGNDLPLPNTGAKLIFPQGSGEDPIEMAYNYTSKGIKLYEPITMGGNEALEFILDKDANQLVSLDGNVIIHVLFSPININQDWQIGTSIPGAVSPAFLAMFNQVKDANTAVYSETLRDFLIFGNTTISGETKPGILFISDPGPYLSQHLLGFGGVPGETEQLSIVKGVGAYNWQFYTHLEPLVDFIANNSPYIVSTTDPAATQIQLTSATDPTVWFYILR